MSAVKHTIAEDGICDVCGYSAEYLLEKATERIAELEALIADAPHHQDCPRSSKHSSFLSCNCWKSRALDTGAKG